MKPEHDTEVLVYPIKQPFKNTFMTHERVKATVIGHYAMELARSGMVMGFEQSTAERKRTVLMSPQVVVERACTIAETLFAEMDKRGWLKTLPALEELIGEDPTKVGF